MYKLLLIAHFLGLSIGAGTGVYMAALSSYAGKLADKSEAKAVMLGPGGVISKVGTFGLGLLLLSGVGMVVGADVPMQWGFVFWLKMILVAMIIVYVASMRWLAARAKVETAPKAAFTMKRLGPLGPMLAMFTIGVAVLAFK
jgi:hypothetical protein